MFLDNLRSIFGMPVPADRRLVLAQRETERIAVAEEELESQRLIALHKRYRGIAGRGEERSYPFSNEETIDLSVGRTNKLIWERPATGIYITEIQPNIGLDVNFIQVKAYIRFDSVASAKYKIRTGFVKTDFSKLYLTNDVQVGKSFKYIIATGDSEFRMLDDPAYIVDEIHRYVNDVISETSLIHNVAMAAADTEYSQAIPTNTKIVRASLADGAAFRYAWVTGKVAAPTAPYMSQPANTPLVLRGINISSKTFYFADPVGTKVMQIETWG